ncbi:transposable element Tc3 transposase [Trichonephila clavipes]|nr:transposable element Tc3 transposase [Trichonephila clavipes]
MMKERKETTNLFSDGEMKEHVPDEICYPPMTNAPPTTPIQNEMRLRHVPSLSKRKSGGKLTAQWSRFVEWAENEIAVVPDFHKRILFSDEAHFWLNGYVNKQSCRIWSEANPQVYVETPLHPEKLTVWCALWAGGIIGPYFFKNDKGPNVTSMVIGIEP